MSALVLDALRNIDPSRAAIDDNCFRLTYGELRQLIDFYAQYLCDHNECRDAKRYLERAMQAPPRPGRELADAGRHREVMELLAKAR
jgi:hypothetical protein